MRVVKRASKLGLSPPGRPVQAVRHELMLVDPKTGRTIERSLNGDYAALRERVGAVVPEEETRRLYRERLARAVRNAIAIRPYYSRAMPESLAIGVGLASLAGMALWYRRIYVIAMPLTGFLLSFPVLGSEGRRYFPVSAFLLLFACLALWTLAQCVARRRSLADVHEALLKRP